MGYLDNSSVIVDAILTKKGRELTTKLIIRYTTKITPMVQLTMVKQLKIYH